MKPVAQTLCTQFVQSPKQQPLHIHDPPSYLNPWYFPFRFRSHALSGSAVHVIVNCEASRRGWGGVGWGLWEKKRKGDNSLYVIRKLLKALCLRRNETHQARWRKYLSAQTETPDGLRDRLDEWASPNRAPYLGERDWGERTAWWEEFTFSI